MSREINLDEYVTNLRMGLKVELLTLEDLEAINRDWESEIDHAHETGRIEGVAEGESNKESELDELKSSIEKISREIIESKTRCHRCNETAEKLEEL